MPVIKKSKFSLFWRGVKNSPLARYLSGREQVKRTKKRKKKKPMTYIPRKDLTNQEALGTRPRRHYR